MRSPESGILSGIKSRCLNPNAFGYEDYGGRGIKVCGRWLGPDGLANFIADMGRRPGPEFSIDRIDNDGDYTPENCRWATAKEQQRNTRRSFWITVNGKTQCAAEWAEETGIPYRTILTRLRRGWDPERAVTQHSRAYSLLSDPLAFNRADPPRKARVIEEWEVSE